MVLTSLVVGTPFAEVKADSAATVAPVEPPEPVLDDHKGKKEIRKKV
ncbi:MAG: hypothetical protein JW839_12415 [Candidatus Lokiarchaeota archaeon]|nr:hypothetical protein [Candidatus Lokiarchaeota archaeon]